MKKKKKKGDYQSLIPVLIITFLFLFVSIYLLYPYFVSESFLDTFFQNGVTLVFGVFFLFFAVLFLIYLFKPPKKYTAVLISKNMGYYRGEAVYDMVFEALKQKKRSGDLVPRKFSCFTYEDNDLVVNQQYTIYVKEVNWIIKKVEPFDGKVSKVPVSANIFVLCAIDVALFALFVLGIVGWIYFPKYYQIYMIWCLLFAVGIERLSFYIYHCIQKYVAEDRQNSM